MAPAPPDNDAQDLPPIADHVALAPLTTLGLGGPARHLVDARSDQQIVAALRWAAEKQLPALILGGGSNVVVADAGVPGLVIRVGTRGLAFTGQGDRVLVAAQAGEPWDALVAATVTRNLGGLECLSGIPGLAGATPIQNVGAYGQEVADTLVSVRAVDRSSLAIVDLPPEACVFAYRDSVFRRHPDRYVVLAVTFALRAGGAPQIRYPELQSALGTTLSPSVADVRATVLRLRARKSMVIDAADPNRRSVGSFFTNPIVDRLTAERLIARLRAQQTITDAAQVPQFPTGDGRVKLGAGWLIEHAGISKGLRAGAVGVSSNHALALVHHGGGSTAELLSLASRIRRAVADVFGITLVPEPVFWGDISLAP